ncbi:hypothetical protein QU593_10200 [Rossellomorea marisflavi]|uniref:hypothetical protein n=1 Tax=Rossellomorea marisflavi TaxID=189381 RepID=UPI0025AF4B97|nr:hypothetical protein [Rossellomorea marisflavi]WJV20776.1 hypothetical protein QU593_10200 [Rossellomorea marisflavi]
MLAKEKLLKAINSCQLALDNLEQGNKRLAIGDLDYAQDFVHSSKMLLISEVIDEEGEL